MDPYEDGKRKYLSPLDKPQAEPPKPVEALVEIPNVAIEEDHVSDEPLIPVTSLLEHLSDLRKQIIKGLTVFILFFIVVFSTINIWFPFITRGHSLVILGPLEVVKFYMTISTTLAFGLAMPFLVHFLWSFIKPGLKEEESRFLGLYAPIMLVLFLVGVAFGYFVVNPLSYTFLVSIGATNFDVMVSANEYMHFLIMTTVPLGLLFELPIVALFLSAIGVLTAESMKKIRGWSYITMGVGSAVVTPPDFISQLLVLIPMIILYEISIYLVKRIERKQIESTA
ncbi:Sec-independent protein translocase protein TatCD [Lysinibacillus fusiformis ZC1]|uniref:twin-arginine translocase subunit TatC n=1 Tax=Lysinibacillus capsici TaxID=2115968 RepID=UPI0001DA4A86|nr:twin-arginine translocase subunit TatC [Lysinibacillus capsici]EFI66122.1 Sec-independent protein translocase protein TatCD [Lysinibacillus fusiformis ZC1]EKU41518.1 Sec-independent protein translocase protein TatCD [Lysinibacillus fusiformis ZB2]MBU5251837.1 twin-arginine translocase subunit TatC [Lysinibacillus capsici]